MFLFVLLNGKYNPDLEPGHYLKIWEVLWDIRGLIIGPAPFFLLGVLFRWFASLTKSRKHFNEGTHAALANRPCYACLLSGKPVRFICSEDPKVYFSHVT